MSFIEVRNLTHIYTIKNENGDIISEKIVLNNLDFTVKEGEFVAILGANGSGKTTLARHLNALLMPTEGSVLIDGKSTTDVAELYAIRSKVGMVFQNPDNQLVAQLLEDEVAFGPENLGLPTEEIRRRVDDALKSVGLVERRHFMVQYLSGGQKQLAAIAGVLALQPKCVVLDEATSMLDPRGRREVLHAVEKLRREKQITIVMITHDVEEAMMADKVCVMGNGRIVLSGKPEDVFQREDEIARWGLELPQAAEIAQKLRDKGISVRSGVMKEEDLRRELARLQGEECAGIWKNGENINHTNITVENLQKKESNGDPVQEFHSSADHVKEKNGVKLLALNHVTQRYFSGTDMQVVALKDVSFSVHAGEFIAVIGQTGSGKSTLLELLGRLTKPCEGTLDVCNLDNVTNAGIVFQYPDHQLFEETVLEDVMFGPKNHGIDSNQAELAARQALQAVKLPEETWDRSPLTLSGGEKRKAALAGVLAMEPKILLLDEPTAGLTRVDRTSLFRMLREEYQQKGKTVLFTTHHMEDAAEFADRVIALHDGMVVFDGTPYEVFQHRDELSEIGLEVPLKIRLEEEFRVHLE